MKLSVSLSEEDVEFIDDYVAETGAASRSSAIQAAIALLRTAKLEDEYASAFAEWDASEEAELWDTTTADGLANAPR
jgi:Arc/MetJ-type ribon-helix-helix transcriptional regulator